jgi:molybdate transport system substrate-binding protein
LKSSKTAVMSFKSVVGLSANLLGETRLLLAAFFASLTVMAIAQTSPSRPASQPLSVYAAGSLRDVMKALEQGYAHERRLASNPAIITPIKFVFGPSGKLRERIEAGDAVHIFISASPTHTERLVATGKLRSSNVFANNSLCVIARPGIVLTEQNVIDMLLSPETALGTSTPGADPSGDYTWEMFKKIDSIRPGAFALLDKKAQKLTGAEISQIDTPALYASILLGKRADVLVTYCTNARIAQKTEPAITSVKVPAQFDVAAAYAIGLTNDAPQVAREFLRYVLSQRAQKVMAEFGFSAPALKCDKVEEPLKAAYAAWSGDEETVLTSTGASSMSKVLVIAAGKRLALTLHAGDSLSFVKRAQGRSSRTFGGAVEFTPATSGHVEVFVDRRSWIDVVRTRDQVAMESVRGDRWLSCAGVGKNLGFMVAAGERYELRLSEIDGPRAVALVMPMSAQSLTPVRASK